MLKTQKRNWLKNRENIGVIGIKQKGAKELNAGNKLNLKQNANEKTWNFITHECSVVKLPRRIRKKNEQFQKKNYNKK